MATGLFNLKQVNQAISQGAWSGYIAPKWVEYLVVAGGGAGGGYAGGGGGGAGGLLTGIVTVAAGTSYTVTVGAGGVGRPPLTGTVGAAPNGSSSSFSAISATGGGGGGDFFSAGASGGSGGGGGGTGGSGPAYIGGASVVNQGNYAGSSVLASTLYVAGGGGGAGTNGLNAVITIGGNGGAGIASSITGVVNTYAGGGGGGTGYRSASSSTSSSGGVGGGGAGANTTAIDGTSGANNTGGGGGGAGFSSASIAGSSGSGGSGIVVVRYPGNVQFYTGGAITYANGYIVHTFVASGTLAPTTPTVVTADYQISRSLRFNSADSPYLARTPATATNRRTWTWSGWIKRSSLVKTNELVLFACRPSAYTIFSIRHSSTANPDTILFEDNNGMSLRTTQVFRDVSAWYHIVLAVDTTQATSTDRVKLYVNGSQVTAFSATTYPTQNVEMQINTTNSHGVGGYSYSASESYDGYMTEVNFIDGQQLTPSSFGATNANTGVWGPKAYTGTYGTNGFYLNFSDNSNTTAATLGKDYSGNGNNWTPNNFSVTAGSGNDSLVDVPTNYGTDYGVGGAVRGNYATFNPLDTNATLSNGNLQAVVTDSPNSDYLDAPCTIGISSGAFYFECVPTAITLNVWCGITNTSASGKNHTQVDASRLIYDSGGDIRDEAGTVTTVATYTTNDVISVAFDRTAGTVKFYKNGTQVYTVTNSKWQVDKKFLVAGRGTWTANFGQRAWAYTPPAGFNALVTQNLPMPAIGTSPTTLANQYFTPVLYTGNGSTQSVTVGFQPDWVWLKNRSSSGDNGLYDVLRGTTNRLVSNSTNAADTISGVTAFNSSGFSLGADYNASANTFVAWNWKANGSGVTNTSGSITSTVSANTTSGFSVVTFTANTAADQTVGHGLGVAPSMIIAKCRNTGSTDWPVYLSSLGVNQFLLLNSTAAVNTATSGYWGTSSPTSTVFGVKGGGYGNNIGTMVAYCFAEVSGYSKFGSYTGNLSTDGPFVYCGFRPAYVIFKRTNSSGTGWNIFDTSRSPYNVTDDVLFADLTNAEVVNESTAAFDILSNGFKLRTTGSSMNGSGDTYIFMAFATSPFKYSLAR